MVLITKANGEGADEHAHTHACAQARQSHHCSHNEEDVMAVDYD